MFSPRDLAATLAQLLPGQAAARYCVAFSGGADSTALLHALAQLRGQALHLRALHVNHHLQPNADQWATHAASVAARLDVPLQVLDVRSAARKGESPEAAARVRRYDLIADALQPDELLLTAHHRDDQLETFLLQLIRGAGVAGLAAMPAKARFARSWHLRPLLDVTRAALVDYVRRTGLEWIEDTSNTDTRFDRNFLRVQVLPALRERWPGIAANVARSAAHMAEARELLDEIASSDLADSRAGTTLQCAALRALDNAHQRNALRYWLRELGFTLPSAARLEEIAVGVLHARPDASPVVRWPAAEVRRYRDRLYALAPLPPAPRNGITWDWKQNPRLELAAGLGILKLGRSGGGLRVRELPCPLRIEWRSPGAKLRPQPDRPARTLRYLFQESGVVPWMRSRVPILVSGQRLIAVAGLGVDVEFHPAGSQTDLRLQWSGHPQMF